MSEANLYGNAASTAPPPAIGGADVRGAIARAAQATGVDFSYLLAEARLESSLDPSARASTSSAAGLYQFTKGTWSTMMARYGGALGIDPTADPADPTAVSGAAQGNTPVSRAQLMALRYDPNASAMMAAALAGQNSAALTTALGRTPTSSELYLAHFLGSAGATQFLGALAANPGQSAAALMPKAAAANRAVFYDASGTPRSLGAVMTLIQTRMDAAMRDTGDPAGNGAGDGWAAPGATAIALAQPQTDLGPIGQQFTAAQAEAGSHEPATSGSLAVSATASMADTLRNTFALAGDTAGSAGAAPAFVRSAYGRMQALGL